MEICHAFALYSGAFALQKQHCGLVSHAACVVKRRAAGEVGVHEALELHPYWAVAFTVYTQTACAPRAPPSLFSHTH